MKPEKQEWPKAIYGPEGQEIVVQDATEAASKLAEWGHADADDEAGTDSAQEPEAAPRRRGRPPKVR